MINNICVSVANHNFNKNAIALKHQFLKYFKHTVIIDSGSTNKDKEIDICLPNVYYTGLWNESVKTAIERKTPWLLFCASDIHIPDINIAINDNIGTYSASVDQASRFSLSEQLNQNTNNIRAVGYVEGFFFLSRVDILKIIYPVDAKENLIGYGIDTVIGYLTRKLGFKSVVDDRYTIHHPKSTHMNAFLDQIAGGQRKRYIKKMKRDWKRNYRDKGLTDLTKIKNSHKNNL